LLRLRLGDYLVGFEKYEWRWKREEGQKRQRKFAKPLWLGDTQVAGQTKFVRTEQGFGDRIQFVRFTDTAAAVSNVDLVISVDTSVAHLAGALGKPVWVLLPLCPDWRWLLDRDDSPWYPTARLFRQPDIGDWESVVGRVRGADPASRQVAGKFD